MPTSPWSVVIQHLMADLRPDGELMSDGELLARFLRSRDEDALAALVRRHAPMVWGVCCRLLRNRHDAEDAFQATFLVLVRKASDVPGQAVANWLYGVARQTSVRLRATAAKRRRRESQVVNMPEPTVAEVRDTDLQIVLDEELSRLPDHYRGVIVLCDLECMTRRQAALQLGIPEGSVASRLARARAMLAKRLTRRGLAVSGGSLAAILSHSVASADVPASVVTSTINVATLLTAGKAAGVISAPVATLTQGVLKTMLLKKILTTTMAVLALGMAVITGGSLAVGQTDWKPAVGKDVKAPVVEKPVKAAVKQENEPVTAWGKEIGGLQAGLGYLPGEKRVYHTGEEVTVVLRVRNVGKEEVKFCHVIFKYNPPTVTDGEGKIFPAAGPRLTGWPSNVEVTLAPGKSVNLTSSSFRLRPDSEKDEKSRDWKLFGTGKFQLHLVRPVWQGVTFETDSILSNLATGKLELEVKEDEPKAKPEAKKVESAKVPDLAAGFEELKALEQH